MSLKLAIAVAFAIATAIGAQIRVPLPFTPVPITLQTFFVLASGMFLGSHYGLLSMVMYLLLGAIGLPVFSGASSGLGVLFGATSGYLLGFLLFSYISGTLYHQTWFQKQNVAIQWLVLFVVSLMSIFAPGVVFLKMALSSSWEVALQKGLYPFLIGDVLKVILAFLLTKWLERRYR